MRPGAPRRGGQAQQPPPAVPAAMAGAVDLGALKARNEAAARAKDAPPPSTGGRAIEVTEANFQTEVIDRSFQIPVLLVLTAARAPSSDQLVTTLESVAGTSASVVRIDGDANPNIVQALRVQAVPTTFAVISGQPIPGFEGALPEAQIREFLKAVMQAAQEAGLSTAAPAGGDQAAEPAEPELPEDPRFTVAEGALDAGDYELAAQRYQEILDQEPANQEAALALGQVKLLQRLDSIDQDAAARADTAPTDVDAQLAAADVSLASNDVPVALDRLLKTVAAVSGDDRDRVRQRLIEIFDLLGPDDPRVPPARRALTRALF